MNTFVLYILIWLLEDCRNKLKNSNVVCVRLRPLLFPCTTDQADLTDWMSFQPSNLMEEISPNTEAVNTNG